MQAKLSPANTLLLSLLFIVLLEILLLFIKTQQPWTGIQLAAGQQHLTVTAVTEGSPAAGNIQPGETLLGIEANGHTIALPPLLMTEPLSIATYRDLNHYLELQSQLEQALHSGQPIQLLTASGKKISITPQPHTRLEDITAAFWWLALANAAGLMVGVMVWMYKPYTLESACLLVTSISYLCANSIFRLLYTKEFHLPPDLMGSLISLESAFFYMLLASLLILLSYYPNRLVPHLMMPLTPTVLGLLAINYHFQWLEVPLHIYILPVIPLILYATWLFYKQWQQSAGNPLNRTTVLMLQLSVLLPTWLIMLLHAVPIILGLSSLIGDIGNRLLIISIFIGWAVGILRFRLFEFEYWWFKSLLWLLGGTLVVVLDVALVGLFELSDAYALGITVMAAGFLYFPLRQWLLGKMLPAERQGLQEFLPVFSSGMADAVSKETFEQRWQDALQQRFHPLNIEKLPAQAPSASLSDNGLHLLAPSLGNQHCYRLSGKQMAARLFNKTDVKNTESLLTVARMASNASETRQQAVLEERRRIMHDLHDSVGAQLMTLMHTVPDPEHKQAARLALTTLRETIRLSQKPSPLRLAENIADWREEINNRAEAAAVRLVWRQDKGLENCLLCPRRALELSQVIREAVSNALKHAEPATLEVGFARSARKLHVFIINDGKISPPENWQAGTGLNSMRERVRALDGEIAFHRLDQAPCKVVVQLSVPLRP